MSVATIPTAGRFPARLSKREAKVIEAARAAQTAGSVVLASLASGITPSHVVKFARFGAGIVTTALAGLVVGDIVIQLTPGIGGVAAIKVDAVATADTLPNNPLDTDYLIVLRAAA